MLTEITVYIDEKKGKVYCEECEPQGKVERRTLFTSGYTFSCDGCGESFKELAERDEEEEPSEDAINDVLAMMQENLFE